jgi:hypothetical protein
LGSREAAHVFNDIALFLFDELPNNFLELLEGASVNIGINVQLIIEKENELLGIIIFL